jgi:hypothetical protein
MSKLMKILALCALCASCATLRVQVPKHTAHHGRAIEVGFTKELH